MSYQISKRDAFRISQPMGQFQADLGWYLYCWNMTYKRWDYLHKTCEFGNGDPAKTFVCTPLTVKS